MLIVGDNLKYLIEQMGIVENNDRYDMTSISLSLGSTIIKLIPTSKIDTLVYGHTIPEECIKKESILDDGLIIPPHSSLLACSNEIIKMPLGYFGLLQTKGSLARMLISLHFSDGQVDPGFKGAVTFEIMNASDFNIKIRKRELVGNLYIFKASTNNTQPYNGRYANSENPTFFKVE